MKISVVIPVYNGEKTLSRLIDELQSNLSVYTLEIVLVNDSSTDNSDEVCRKLAVNSPHIKYICLRKNFGEHNAVICGLNYCTGDYIAIIDDDFQNPPSEIVKLIDEAKKGFDVVYSRYDEKKHNVFRNLGSKINDRCANLLLNKPKNLYLSSFKVIKGDLLPEIIKYKGPFPYIDGLILRCTNNIGVVTVQHNSREEGKSNYTIKKLVSLYLNMFLNFSVKPLRIFTLMGIVLFFIGILYAGVILYEKLFHSTAPTGYSSLMVALLLFSGFQIIFLGLIGEYLGKQYLDQNGSPQYIILKEINTL